MAKLFVEAVIAPGYDPSAIEVLGGKKNVRVMVANSRDRATDWARFGYAKAVSGGVLFQTADDLLSGAESRVVTSRKPDERESRDLNFAWQVVKHVKSNAIVLAEGGRTVGVGAGQMSRVDSVKISIQKASPTAKGGCPSLPTRFSRFATAWTKRGQSRTITAIVQPGGSGSATSGEHRRLRNGARYRHDFRRLATLQALERRMQGPNRQ